MLENYTPRIFLSKHAFDNNLPNVLIFTISMSRLLHNYCCSYYRLREITGMNIYFLELERWVVVPKFICGMFFDILI